MNGIKVTGIFIILFLSFVYSSAQHVDLAGTWRLDVSQSVALMSEINRHRFDSLNAEVKQRARASMEGRKFVFQADGEITVIWNMNGRRQESNGRWSIAPGAHRILEIVIDGVAETYDFEINPNHWLILRNTNPRGLFQTQYFAWQ